VPAFTPLSEEKQTRPSHRDTDWSLELLNLRDERLTLGSYEDHHYFHWRISISVMNDAGRLHKRVSRLFTAGERCQQVFVALSPSWWNVMKITEAVSSSPHSNDYAPSVGMKERP